MIALSADQAYRKAYQCYVSRRFDKAEDICRKVLAADPGHADAAYLLALLVVRHGNHEEGDRLLRHAVEQRAFSIRLGYRPPSSPRHAAAPHAELDALLARELERYLDLLRSFDEWVPRLQRIPVDAAAADAPHWSNAWIPPLDGVALYCMVARGRPRRFVEVGSGNSTKFVRRAIIDQGLATEMISIDPQPRVEIDALCDIVIRKPLEETDLALFAGLDARDLVFIDNSHRCYMNSDVTVFFTEILPALARGVTVGIHDIFLPYDYPAEWVDRYYSEQYLLACYLLARTPLFRVLLPMHFVLKHAHGRDTAHALSAGLPGAPQPVGTSFWLQMN